jgi:hypothetical protein
MSQLSAFIFVGYLTVLSVPRYMHLEISFSQVALETKLLSFLAITTIVLSSLDIGIWR